MSLFRVSDERGQKDMVINKVNWAKTFLTSSINSNKAKIPIHILPIMLAIFFGLSLMSPAVYADDYPPCWDGSGTPNPVHWSPTPWPDEAAWVEYTHDSEPIKDKRIQDPSNGGRAPQNYANVSSSCSDQALPSVSWTYDEDTGGFYTYQTLYFRWKVEQIANSYATGPSPPGPARNNDPWKEAQWTVLMDFTGDGYYDFAVHIDGQSGKPGEDIDVLQSIYNTSKSQSIDWQDDPNVYRLFHNPTAFVDCSGGPTDGYIYNFRNSFSPTTAWLNGSAETVWDYGQTRAIDITTYNPDCIEYNIDYQIPLDMLDASSVGGPTIDPDDPFCMTFVTANSNIDPLQKDVAFDGSFTFSVDDCVPCGDLITLSGGASIPQPVVDWVTAEGCGPTDLTAQVRDAINPDCESTLASVDFYYYYDANGNSIADDGGSWAFEGSATVDPDDPSQWTYTGWDTTGLLNGQYLVGVRAEDVQGNVTWSYLTQAEVDVLYSGDYANPDPKPGVVFDTFINYCGEYVEVTKSVNPASTTVGNTVQFTITVNNQTSNNLTVNSISDQLPPGFVYATTDGGTLNPIGPPTIVGNTITWTLPPDLIIGGGTGTLLFTATAPMVEGTYTNVASANTTEFGVITSDPVDVGVGLPYLTISKTSNEILVDPGDTIIYTITYSNDSPVNVTDAVITDELPLGLTYVPGSASNGGTYDSATHTITWNIGSLASLEGPYTVSYSVTVDADASTQPQNYACINATGTNEACTSRVVTVDTPLKLQKTVDQIIINPGDTVTFTIEYKNTGSDLNNAEITDPVPTGFDFVSSSAGTNCPAGAATEVIGDGIGDDDGTCESGEACIVTWDLADPLNQTPGTCNFVAQASNPYTGENPAINIASITADDTPEVSASAQVGIIQSTCEVPVRWHMHSTTIDVGWDGIQKEANETAPTSATDTIINSPQGTGTPVEFARFYQDPPLDASGTLLDPVTVTYWAIKTQGNPTVWAYLYDYDPTAPGPGTLLGSGSASAGGTLKQYTITFSPSGSVVEGHRLLWIFSVQGNGATIDFHYDSTTHDANSDICILPTSAVINKDVDNITAVEGGSLTYTINFGNTSSTDLTGAQITDTLPDGIASLDSAFLNGSGPLTDDGDGCPINPGDDYCCDGLVCTFHVNTSDTGTQGQLTSSESGWLTLNVTIETPIVFDHNPLTNLAELDTDQTEPISDTATTNVTGVPIIGVKKRVDDSLLEPGVTTTFYIDFVNIGTANLDDYTVVDYITGQLYLTFEGISDSGQLRDLGGGTCDAGEACTITWSSTILGSLTPNETKTVSYDLKVSSDINPPEPNGVPEGFTTETDYADVKDDTGATIVTSNTVMVTLYTNANLNITKTYSPDPVYAGDTVTYTMTVTNVGATDATSVLVTDPIPANTSYNAGTLIYDSPPPQTDMSGDDNAYFDALNNRVVFEIGTMASLASHTLQFSVTVDETLPDGTTTITNTATASASNTASKQATAVFDVDAAPVLTLAKSAPDLLSYPLTQVTVGGTQTFTVGNVLYIYAGDIVYINGDVCNVTAVDPTASTITCSQIITVVAGENVDPTIKFRLTYKNSGDSDTTNVTISDTLSSSPQLNYITASPLPTTDPGDDANGTVTWDIGTVAAGETGSILLWARPTTTGTYLNTATMSSTELDDVTSNETTTIVGGMELTKSTSTPNVVNDPTSPPVQATYTITLTPQLSIKVNNVTVTDNLPTGFTYNSTSSITGANQCVLPEAQPVPDLSNPTWSGCNITVAGSTMTITFIVDIAPTVGAGTYQNPVTATTTELAVLPFDELLTTAEDVTITVPNDIKITKEILSIDDPCIPGSCQIQYRVQAIRVGTNNFTGVVVDDILPGELINITHTETPPGSYDELLGVWTIGNLPVTLASEVIGTDANNYTCIAPHIADAATNQPIIGSSWQDFWELGGTSGVAWGPDGTPYNAEIHATLDITATVNALVTDIQNCASLNTSTPADTNTANNQACVDITPTLVVLSDFIAYEENGQVVIEWSTSSEVNTIGFYLFRLDESTGEYIRINEQILPGLLTSPQGGTYSLVDTGVSPYNNYTYVLMEIENKGKQNTYGPFTVQAGGGNAVETQSSTQGFNAKMLGECTAGKCGSSQKTVSSIKKAFNSQGIVEFTNRDNGKVQQNYGPNQYANYTRKAHKSAHKETRLQASKQQLTATRSKRANRSGDMAKISVIDDGVYYLDSSKISSLLGISSEDAVKMIGKTQLALSNQGRDVAYLPAEGNAGIFFYGEGIDSIYTNENIYWLKEDSGLHIEPADSEGSDPSNPSGHLKNGKRFIVEGSDPWNPTYITATIESGTFTETLHFEEDRIVVPAITHDPNTDYWFWDFIGTGSPYLVDTKTYEINLNGVADTSSPARLIVSLKGLSNTDANPDHHAVIKINGNLIDPIGDGKWEGTEAHTIDLPFDQALLSEGANSIEVKALLDTGAPYSMFYVDSFDLTYERLYEAVEDSLVCRGGSNQTVTVNGFTDPDILIFDIADPYMPRLVELTTIDYIDGTYRVSFVPSSPDTPYIAFSSSAASTEFTAWADIPSDLSDKKNNADYIIISTEELADAAQSLANYRNSQGLETKVVMLGDIMDEFNYGISSPEAIQDFLTHAYQDWKKSPRYVVLAGEGNYDYKDSMGLGDNLVPTMMVDTPFGLTPSDNIFADVDGDHVPEMAIGRLSVLTSEELQDILNKIIMYENSYGSTIVMLADDPDSGGNFPADSDDIAALVPPTYMLTKIYLSEYDLIDARQLLMSALNSGAFLLNYFGHASTIQLANEGLLRISDLDQLTNLYGLPIVTAMTCTVGKTTLPGFDSLSEALVLKGDGGAVAVWAPTGLAYHFESKILDREFFNAAFENSTAILGDVILKAFQEYNTYGGNSYLLDIYNLQGDPALKMR
jgi:uncharacterized repeat protein (TIGR01451 family)